MPGGNSPRRASKATANSVLLGAFSLAIFAAFIEVSEDYQVLEEQKLRKQFREHSLGDAVHGAATL
jgi:D-serine dehydratase